MKRHTQEHFFSLVEPVTESGCRIWLGTTDKKGYGLISWNGKTKRVHRLVYELTRGPIPPGMLVCHRCDVPSCENPDHFFLGSAQDNTMDGFRKGRIVITPLVKAWVKKKTARTHCKRGHPYSGDNLIIHNEGGRRCKTCSYWKPKRRLAHDTGRAS